MRKDLIGWLLLIPAGGAVLYVCYQILLTMPLYQRPWCIATVVVCVFCLIIAWIKQGKS